MALAPQRFVDDAASEPLVAPRTPLSRRGMNSKQYLQSLLGELRDYQAQARGEAAPGGYYDTRMRGADANADWFSNQYTTKLSQYGNEAEQDNASFQTPDYTDPTYDGGPAEPGVEDYDRWMQEHAGRTGNTTEPDLTKYADRAYYLPGRDALPDYLRDAIDDKGGTDIGSPDFQGQFNIYAESANNRFRDTLSKSLEGLFGASMGRGRFNSGFLDDDTGTLAQTLSRQARDDVNAHAIDVLGLQESDVASRRSTAASRASTRGQAALDAANLTLRAGETAAGAGKVAADSARANRGELRGQYEDERDTAEDRFRDRRDTGRENFESDRTAGRHNYEDSRDFAYDAFTGDRADRASRRAEGAGYWSDAAKWTGARSMDAYDRSEDQKDRYADLLSGNADRAQGLYNAKQQRRASFFNSLLGGAATVGAAAL